MRKLLSIILCFMIAMSFVACGKKEEPKNSPEIKESANSSEVENTADENAGTAEEQTQEGENEPSGEATVLPPTTAEELEAKIDEFNTTEDPERKEELRKELEEFLKQAEEMANQG